MATNVQVLLASRPVGWVEESHFHIVESPVPEPAAGQLLIKNLWLSVDPYMRGRMGGARSYAPPVRIGEVMVGETVGEVVESSHPRFGVGDTVVGRLGWQLYAISEGDGLRKVDPALVPISCYLGAAGMPGATAWIGLFEHCRPTAGETVAVSAAAGAVGSVVGQLARMQGCRAVGIAGGKVKCDHVVNELGFDACVDYKAGNLRRGLAQATPDGIDCYFENVGGEVMDTVFGHLNPFARVAVCGLVSDYNLTEPYGMKTMRSVLVNRVSVHGFIVSDRQDLYLRAVARLAGWVAEGKITYHETVAEGLRSAPAAFIGMLKGANLGKQLVKL
jgi:NADPH-dependent curcumin reductase